MEKPKVIDLRSDTVTHPTPEMRDAMRDAEVGDDVFGEDPTVARLEAAAATLLGKEAAMFVPSGTMGNLVAISVHVRPGDEVILEERGHTVSYELGGMAVVAGAMPRPVWAEHGRLTADLIEPLLTVGRAHRSRTGLIIVENTHNLAGGTVSRPESTEAVISLARAHGVPVHLDGARLFNAAAALGLEVEELAVGYDSVMFCLSKGLAAPAGSLLLGNRAFIEGARRVRKMLGGGMRQVGVLAAAGLVALTTMPPRLIHDHERASRLAAGIAAIPGIDLEPKRVETNIIIFGVQNVAPSAMDLVQELRTHGILALALDPVRVRMVTHYEIDDDDIDRTIATVSKLL